jgi:glucose-6-phosphate isomerase
MTHIKFDYSKLLGQFVEQEEIDFMQTQVNVADEYLRKGTGPGSDFLGWVDLPENYDKEEFARIQKAAAKIQSDSEVLVVIGIGGSYLGARAAIDFLSNHFYNLQAPIQLIYSPEYVLLLSPMILPLPPVISRS